jgi:hypothetical protein
MMAWGVSDDLSGVLNEWGIVDIGTASELTVANGSFVVLSPGQHTLTVFAEDRAGNASQEETTFTVYPFEWLPPLDDFELFTAKAGRTIPVKFEVHDLSGVTVKDTSVELRLLDVAGNTVAGPFVFANNPNQGVAILGNGQYHHNLRTAGLPVGTYILQVTFNSSQLGGRVNKTIQLLP